MPTGNDPPDWGTPTVQPQDPAPDLEAVLPPELATQPGVSLIVLDHRERYKYLVAYDIRDPRRLAHVADRLKDFGARVQYSVFECLLAGADCERMWTSICALIDHSVDWLVMYRLSKPHDEAIRHVGHYDQGLLDADIVLFV